MAMAWTKFSDQTPVHGTVIKFRFNDEFCCTSPNVSIYHQNSSMTKFPGLEWEYVQQPVSRLVEPLEHYFTAWIPADLFELYKADMAIRGIWVRDEKLQTIGNRSMHRIVIDANYTAGTDLYNQTVFDAGYTLSQLTNQKK